MNSHAQTPGQWIQSHAEAMFDCLAEWVACDSTFPNELPLQRDRIEPFLRSELSLDQVARVNVCAEADRPFVVGVWQGQGGGRSLLLNGHVDTVGAPGSMRDRWSTDPWQPVVKDGRLYGRGTADMKAGVVAMLWAVKALQETGARLRGNVLLAMVPGEETMRYDIGSVPAARWFQERGFEIPFAIVTEPTHLEIHVRSPGQLDFSIEVTGKEIHTSMRNLALYPQRAGIPQGSAVGVDAIAKLARILLLLEDLERQWAMRWRHPLHGGGGYPLHEDHQGVGGFSINRTFVEGGTYEGSLPGYARVTGIISYPSWVQASEVQAEFERVLQAHCELDDWLREHPPAVTVGQVYQWPPLAGPHDSPGPQALGQAYTRVTARPAIFTGAKFVGDASFLQRDCGIPAVYFGPGDCSMGVHGPDEYVPLDQVVTCATTLAEMLEAWCG
jgi:acetylornithine deacetylase/succinyl-diaminopimelate desuccinylase-like protein